MTEFLKLDFDKRRVAMTNGSWTRGCSSARASSCVGIVVIVASLLVFLRIRFDDVHEFQLKTSVSNQLITSGPPLQDSSSPPRLEYEVCLILSIGDDSSGPNDRALPFTKLYRLFNATKSALSELLAVQQQGNSSLRRESSAPMLPPAKVNLLVGVDYTSVACRMARDVIADSGEEFRRVTLACQSREEVGLAANRLASSEDGLNARIRCGTTIMATSSQYVTQLTPEWQQFIRLDKLKAVDVDERDRSWDPPAIPREMWRPTIVTGFSSNHIPVGLLLLRSIAKAGKEAAAAGLYNVSIVMYAMEEFNVTMQGIIDCVIREINEEYKVPFELRRFNFSAYPPWMRINQTLGYYGGTGEYAWKAIMIHDVIVERGLVLWLDAGRRVNFPALSKTLKYTQEHGFANRYTPGKVPNWVHEGMLKYFRYAVRTRNPPRNCDGSGVGLSLDKYTELARPWYECSLTRQCIAPDGSDRGNHRQDQAALTLISDITGNPCKGVNSDIHRHMDYHPRNFAETDPTKCYQDPLEVIPAS